MMSISFFHEGVATRNPTGFRASTPIPASRRKSVQGWLGGLILFLFTGGVAQALQLQNAAVADPPVASTNHNIPASAADDVGNPALPGFWQSEFKSLVVASFQPVNATLDIDQDPGTADLNRPAEDTASVTLKTLAWLVGIGIIGMGTVGRRRRK